MTFDYQAYLASREWALLREKVRERSGNRCEHCRFGPQQAVHHLTYARKGHEDLSDLMAICNDCHEFLSGKSDLNPLLTRHVVSPVIPAEEPGRNVHLILPRPSDLFLAIPLHVVTCAPICLFCNYVDQTWLRYMGHLYWVNKEARITVADS